MQTPDDAADVFVEDTLEKQENTQSLTMWQWKQQMPAKFGTDDVTRPSKRFAFDGLKIEL